MASSVAISALATLLLLLSPEWPAADVVVFAEGNLLDSQNVFGWKKSRSRPSRRAASTTSRHAASSSLSPLPPSPSSSPLRRSENVFGWQRTKIGHTKNGGGITRRNDGKGEDGEGGRTETIIVNASSNGGNVKNAEREDDGEGRRENRHPHLSPPNIKIQPRKKELWLPWPLGEMRSDFHRFAAEHDVNSGSDDNNNSSINARQEWRPRNSEQQHHPRNHYGDEGHRSSHGEDHAGFQGAFRQGRDWASRMLQRGAVLLPLPTAFDDGGGEGGGEAAEAKTQQQSRYWIKDATTSMAAASSIPSLGKNNDKKKLAKRQKKGGGRGSKSKDALRGGEGKEDGEDGEDGNGFDRDVLFRYLKLQASVRLRQLGYVGSDLSVHLPPAAPILLFYYFYPSRQDPLKRLVRYTVAGAALGWMHSEATKYRRFAPLPGMKGMNVRAPNLPPFLPEKEWKVGDVEGQELDATVASVVGKSLTGSRPVKVEQTKSTRVNQEEDDSSAHNQHHHLWDPFQSFGTISSAYRTWLEGHNLRNERTRRRRRTRAQEQLLATKEDLAAAASNSTIASSKLKASPSATPVTPAANGKAGYALITGASTGIGRALAVELARYSIPLILVARDLTKLSGVAEDIETYYSVPVRVLRADLSEPDCARRIHEATLKEGLEVDILVNNAGVCEHGNFIDGDDGVDDADAALNMLQVNINAATQLSRLYGRDMKERRRGRILFVSSMSGVLPGCPSVAVYAASKAYGKSLSMSLGREMERYGVGVTCLLPGAVKTSFASNSEVEDALCFHVPGYAITPELVAGVGIKGLMLGYPEVYPGWHNRAFVKMVMPIIPSRVSNMIGEWMWNPLQWGDVMPSQQQRRRRTGSSNDTGRDQQRHLPEEGNDKSKSSPPLPTTSSAETSAPGTSTWKFPRLPSSPLNSQTQLPDVVPKPEAGSPSLDATMKLLVDPSVKGVLAQTFDHENTTIISQETEPGKLDVNSQNLDDKGAGSSLASPSDARRDTASERAGESSFFIVGSNKNQNDDGTPTTPRDDVGEKSQIAGEENGTKNEEEAPEAPAAQPKSLVLPPASSPPRTESDSRAQSPPSTLFGFVDKDRPSSPISSSESTDARDTGAISSEKSDDAGKKYSSSRDTWYPSMMDTDGYDFRDRRLDY